jgi:uncharacterized protein (TIGR02145 family)
MKKECKRIPLWKCKGLLSVALSIFTVVAHAQGTEVCSGTAYTILSTVDASGAATYQWLENGQLIPGASAATYTVPGSKAAGLYAYIRQAKSADCNEWQQSNEFVVTVFNCSFTAGTATSATATFIDPRDGKSYKTVVMPDGRTWFAQNLNYTKDLTYNPYAYAYESNGNPYNPSSNGVAAIGSYWCPAAHGAVASGSEADCRTYGALYTWETAMMVDGKYADETKTSSVWDESWVSPYYYSDVPNSSPIADKNNGRGGTNVKGGGRGICPMGWHIPTDLEWAIMLDKVESDGNGTLFVNADIVQWLGTDAGIKLKSSATYTAIDDGTGAWLSSPLTTGSDAFGFKLLPAGTLRGSTGLFDARGRQLVLRTASVYSMISAYTRYFSSAMAGVLRVPLQRNHGLGLRCISDK